MPKTATKSRSAWPDGLRIIAALFFLYVIFGGTNSGAGWWSPLVLSGAGSIWFPILLGVAVLTSIALFFGSLASLVFKTGMGSMGWKTLAVASFALVALTVPQPGLAISTWSSVFWLVIVGFILGWVASAMEMMM
ncbi:MAG: hypothetical protein ABSA33_01735 [Candidatus Micrarchaeaceae archaeon]|jgi:hypothetical protein